MNGSIPTGVHGGDSPEHRGEQESGSGLTPAPEPHRIEGTWPPEALAIAALLEDPGFNQLALSDFHRGCSGGVGRNQLNLFCGLSFYQEMTALGSHQLQ